MGWHQLIGPALVSVYSSHAYKLCTQADTRIRMNPDKNVFFDILKHVLIKTYPKHVSTPPMVLSFHLNSSHNNPKHVPIPLKVLDFHLNPSHSKTHAFTCPNIKIKDQSKTKKMRKFENSPILPMHLLRDDLVTCRLVEETHSALLSYSNM